VVSVTIYIWYKAGRFDAKMNLATNLDTIYNDMLRFVVAGAHGSSATMAQGRALGPLILLDIKMETIFPVVAEEDNLSQNTEAAKSIFRKELERVKETNLTEALEKMELNKWKNLGEFEEIKLGTTGDALNQFKMIAYASKDKKIQILHDKYEEDFEAFKGVMDLKGSKMSIIDLDYKKGRSAGVKQTVIKFEFTIEYNETLQYNKKQLGILGFEDIKMKKFEPTVTPIEDRNELLYEDIIHLIKGWKQIDIDQLKDKILKIIYEGLKEQEVKMEIKNVILNPKYVTKFSIKNGTYKATYPHGRATETDSLRYTMDIKTTHRLPSEELIEPSLYGLKTPKKRTQLDRPGMGQLVTTKKIQREQSMRAEERGQLIDKIQARIERLERAIEEL
jgi:hypothetical protein